MKSAIMSFILGVAFAVAASERSINELGGVVNDFWDTSAQSVVVDDVESGEVISADTRESFSVATWGFDFSTFPFGLLLIFK